jgi:polar amino acid transport system substrate-binding protein
MRTRRQPTIPILALAAVLLAVAGCASGSDEAQRTSLAALATPPAAAPAGRAPTSGPAARCSDPTASLRPPASLPRPGALPPRSFMAQVRRRGRLIAGVDQNTLLFGYLKPSTARIEGFEVDLLREVARAILGDPNAIELKALTTAQRLPAVQSGAVDIVADAVTITCDRRREVAFSTVYYDASQRLLVPRSSPASSLADLAGRRVCATTGSTTLQRIKSDRAKPVPYPVPQRTDCLVALQQGRVDAISSDDAILLGFKAQDPNTKIVGRSLADEPYGMAIARGHPEFVRFVNGVLERVRRDGAWKAIHRRWIGRLAPTPSAPRPRYSD